LAIAVCAPATRSLSFIIMKIVERIASELTSAMKAKDAIRTGVMRMAKSALKNREIEKRAELDDTESLRVLQTLVKQREEAALQFEKGGRSDLAEKERAEIVILREFFPEEISERDIEACVEQAMMSTGASSLKDLGRVMKAAMELLRETGKSFDGKRVNEVVRRRLGGG
jgi:uncharacterized protein YqeY